MTFHVKKKDTIETNQTAIIKPFSKGGGNTPGDTGITQDYDEPQSPQSFNCSLSQSPLNTISQHAAKAKSFSGGEDEEEALTAYMTDHSGGVRRRGGDSIQNATMLDCGDISAMGVGDIGMGMIGGQPQSITIMDQISCVVNRFTANISELNTMMLPGGATISTINSNSALPTPVDTNPCPPQQYLTS